MRHSDDPPRLPWYGGCAAYGQEPDWGRFRFHRAAMLAAANRSLEAIDVPGEAMALKPNDERKRWDRGLNYLLLVDYARRWPGKIWRVERYPGDHSDPIGADVGERIGDQTEKEKSLRPLFRHAKGCWGRSTTYLAAGSGSSEFCKKAATK